MSYPGFRERHLTARSLVPAVNTPEQFAEEIRKDRAAAGQVVKDAGLEPQWIEVDDVAYYYRGRDDAGRMIYRQPR